MFQFTSVRWSQVFVIWFICLFLIQNLVLTSAKLLVAATTDSLNPGHFGDTQDYPEEAESNAEMSSADSEDSPEASAIEEKSFQLDREIFSLDKNRLHNFANRNKPGAYSTSLNRSSFSSAVNSNKESVFEKMGKEKSRLYRQGKNTKSSPSRKHKKKRIISFERKKNFPEFPPVCNQCTSENLSIVPICSKKLVRKQDLSSPEKIAKKAHVHIGNVSGCHLNVHSSTRNNSCKECEPRDKEQEGCVLKPEKYETSHKTFKHFKNSTVLRCKTAKPDSSSSSVSRSAVITSSSSAVTSNSLISNNSLADVSVLELPHSTLRTISELSEVSKQPEEQPKKFLLPISFGSQFKHRSTTQAFDQSDSTKSTSIKSWSCRNQTNASLNILKFVSTTQIFQSSSEQFESTADPTTISKPEKIKSCSEKQIENRTVVFDPCSTLESFGDDHDVQVTLSAFESKNLNKVSAESSDGNLGTPSVFIAGAENGLNNSDSSDNSTSDFNETSTSMSLFELLDSIQKEGQLLIDLRNTSAKIPGFDFVPSNKTLRVNHSSLANISFSLLEESDGRDTSGSNTPALATTIFHGLQNFDQTSNNRSNFSTVSLHHNPLNRTHNIPLSSLLDLNVKPHETCKFWKFGSHCKCMQDLLDKKEDTHPELSDRNGSSDFREKIDVTNISNSESVREINKFNRTDETFSRNLGSKSIIDANEIDLLKVTNVTPVRSRNEAETVFATTETVHATAELDFASTKTYGIGKPTQFFEVSSADKVEGEKNKTFKSIEIKKPNGTLIPILSPDETTRSIKSSSVFDSVETINDAERICLEKLNLLQAIKKLILNDTCVNDWPSNNISKPSKLVNSSISEPNVVPNGSNKRVSDSENLINSTHELIDNTANVFTLVTKLPFLISNALSKNLETFSELNSDNQISESPIPKVDKFALKIFMDGHEIYNDMVSRDFFHSIRLNQLPESSRRNDFVADDEIFGIPKQRSSIKQETQDDGKYFPFKIEMLVNNGSAKDEDHDFFHSIRLNRLPESSKRNDFLANGEVLGIPKQKSSSKQKPQGEGMFFPLKMSLLVNNGSLKDKESKGIFHKVKNNIFTFGKGKAKSVKDSKISEPASLFLDHFSDNESKLFTKRSWNEAEPLNLFKARNLQCDYDYDTAVSKDIDFKDGSERTMSARSVAEADARIPIFSSQNDMNELSERDGDELVFLEMTAKNSLLPTTNEFIVSSADRKSDNHQSSSVNINSVTASVDNQSLSQRLTFTSGQVPSTSFSGLQTHEKDHKKNKNELFFSSNFYPEDPSLSRPFLTEVRFNTSDLAEVRETTSSHLIVNSFKSPYVQIDSELGKKQSRSVSSKILTSDSCSKNVSSNDFLEMLSNTFGNSSNSHASNLKQNVFNDFDGSLILKKLSPSKIGGGEYFSLFLSNVTDISPLNQNVSRHDKITEGNSFRKSLLILANSTLNATGQDFGASTVTTPSFSNNFDKSAKSNLTRNNISAEFSCPQKNFTHDEFFLSPSNNTMNKNKVLTNNMINVVSAPTNFLKNSSGSQSIFTGILTIADKTSPRQIQVAVVTESAIPNFSNFPYEVNVSKTSKCPPENLSPTKTADFSSVELHKLFFSRVSPPAVFDSKLSNTSKVETKPFVQGFSNSNWLNAFLPKGNTTVIAFSNHVPPSGNTSSAALGSNVSVYASNFVINTAKADTSSDEISILPTISVMAGQNALPLKGNLSNGGSAASDFSHVSVSAKNSPSLNLQVNENLDTEGTQNSSIVFIQNTTILKIPVFLAKMGNLSSPKSNLMNFSFSSIPVSPGSSSGSLSNTSSIANAFNNFIITENLALQKLQNPSFSMIGNSYNATVSSTPRLNSSSQNHSNFSGAPNVVFADGLLVNEAVPLLSKKETINDTRNTPASVNSENMSYPLRACTGLSSYTNTTLYRKKKVYPKFIADVKNKIQFLTPMILLNRSVTLEPNSGCDLKIPVEGKFYEEKTLPSNISTPNNSEPSFIPSALNVALPAARITIGNATASNHAFFSQISKKSDTVENLDRNEKPQKSIKFESELKEPSLMQKIANDKCFLSIFVFNDTKGIEYHVMKYNNESNSLNFDNCLVLKQKNGQSPGNPLSSRANPTLFSLSSDTSNCLENSSILIQPDSSLSLSILEDKQGLSQFTEEFNKITANQEVPSNPSHSNDQHCVSFQQKNFTHPIVVDSQLTMNESRNLSKQSQVSGSFPVPNATHQVFKFQTANATLSINNSSFTGHSTLPTVSSVARNSSTFSVDFSTAQYCSEKNLKPDAGSRNLPSFPEKNKGEILRKSFNPKTLNKSNTDVVASHLSVGRVFTTPLPTQLFLTKPIAENKKSMLPVLKAQSNRTLNLSAVSPCNFNFLDFNATRKPPSHYQFPSSSTESSHSQQTLVTVLETIEKSPRTANSDVIKTKRPKNLFLNSSNHSLAERNNHSRNNFSPPLNQAHYFVGTSSNAVEIESERIQPNNSVKPVTILMATEGGSNESSASNSKSKITLSESAKSKLHNMGSASGSYRKYHSSSLSPVSTYQMNRINMMGSESTLNQMMQNDRTGSRLIPEVPVPSTTLFLEPSAAINWGQLKFNVFTTEFPPSLGRSRADQFVTGDAGLKRDLDVSSQTPTALRPHAPQIFLGHELSITNSSLRPLVRHNTHANPSFHLPEENHVFVSSRPKLKPYSPSAEMPRNDVDISKEMQNQIYLPMNQFPLSVHALPSNMNWPNFLSAPNKNSPINNYQLPTLQKSPFEHPAENFGPEITTMDYSGFRSTDSKLDSSPKYQFFVGIPSKFSGNVGYQNVDQSRIFFSSTGRHLNNIISTSPYPVGQSSSNPLPVVPVAAKTDKTDVITSSVMKPSSTRGETEMTRVHERLNLILSNEITTHLPHPTFFNQPLSTPGSRAASQVFLVINNYNQPCSSDQKLLDFRKKSVMRSGGPVAKLRILAKPDVFLSFLKRNRTCSRPSSEDKNLPESASKTTCFCNAVNNNLKNRHFCSRKRSNIHKRINHLENSAAISREPKSSQGEFSFTSSSGSNNGSFLIENFPMTTNNSGNELTPTNSLFPVNRSVSSQGAAHIDDTKDSFQNINFVPLNTIDVGSNVSSNDVSFINHSNSSTERIVATGSSKINELCIIQNSDQFFSVPFLQAKISSPGGSSFYPNSTLQNCGTRINVSSVTKGSNLDRFARLNELPSGTLEPLKGNVQSAVQNFSKEKIQDNNVERQLVQPPILIFDLFSRCLDNNLSTLLDNTSGKVFKVYGNEVYGLLESPKFPQSSSKLGSSVSNEGENFGSMETTAHSIAYISKNEIPPKTHLPSQLTLNEFLQKAQTTGGLESKNVVATEETEHLHFEQPRIRQGLRRKSCNRPHFRGQIPCLHSRSHRFRPLQSRHHSRMSSGKTFAAPRKSFEPMDPGMKSKQLKANHLPQVGRSRNLKTLEDCWTNPPTSEAIGAEPDTLPSRRISSHDQRGLSTVDSKANSNVTEYLGDSILLFEDDRQSKGMYGKSFSPSCGSGLKKEADPTSVEYPSTNSLVNFGVTANLNFRSEKFVQKATNKPLILKILIQNITEDSSGGRIKNRAKFKSHQGLKGNARKIHSKMEMSSPLLKDSKGAAFNSRPDRSVIKSSEWWQNDSLVENNSQPAPPGNPFDLLFAGQQKLVEVSNDGIAELPVVMKKLMSLHGEAAPEIQVGKREERQSNVDQIGSKEVEPFSKSVLDPSSINWKPPRGYLFRKLKSYYSEENDSNLFSRNDVDFESENGRSGGISKLFRSNNKIQISRLPETSSSLSWSKTHEKKPQDKSLTKEQSISSFNRNASEIFNRAFENNASNLLLIKKELDHFSNLLLKILKECPTSFIKGSSGELGAEKLQQERPDFSDRQFFSLSSSTLRPLTEPVKNHKVPTSYPVITPFAGSLEMAENAMPVASSVARASRKEVSDLLSSQMKLPKYLTALIMPNNILGITSTLASARKVFSATMTNYQASNVNLQSFTKPEFVIPMNQFGNFTSQLPFLISTTKPRAAHEISTNSILIKHSYPISHHFLNVTPDQSLEWFIPSDQNLKRNKHLILKWVQKLFENSSSTESGAQFDLPAKDCKRIYNTNCVCDMGKVLSNYDKIICDKTYSEERKLHKILDFQCSSYLPLPLGYNINSESKPRILTSKKKQMVSDDSSGPKEIDVEGLNYLLHVEVTPPGASSFHNAFAGSKILIPCFDTAKVSLPAGTADGTKYKWRKGDKVITDGRVKETPEGVLVIENVALNDAGQYLCTVLFVSPESSSPQQRIFNHTLGVVTVPKIAIQALVHYKANTECTPAILEMLDLYLPQQIQESICDYGEEDSDICLVDVYNPLCFKNSTESTIISLNVQMDVKGIDYLLVGGANKTVCSPMCHQKLYLKTSLILKESLHEALLTNVLGRTSFTGADFIPVQTSLALKMTIGCDAGFYQTETFCVPCPSHTYSEEGSTQCSKCPFNFYQPQPGSRACIRCPFPLAPGCNTISRKAASSFTKLLAKLLLLLLFITVAYFFTVFIIKNFRLRKEGKIFSRNVISKKILGRKDGKAKQKPSSKKKKTEEIELSELLPLSHYDSDHSTGHAETEFGADTTERTRSAGSVSSAEELDGRNLDFLIIKSAKRPEDRGRLLPKIPSPVRRKYFLQDKNDKLRLTNERNRAPPSLKAVQKAEKSVQTPKRKKKPPLPKPDFT